jgi:hypothetical protein
MLKLASKFAMDILPSVIATVIGAYIVNHYINNRPPAGTTPAAISSVDAKKAVPKPDSKPAEKSADLGHVPEPGVRAKGISEKAINEKSAPEKSAAEKSTDKADKPSETASIPPTPPAETRRHQPAPREKAASKAAPAAAPAAEPSVAATSSPAEPMPDANDLARAAIERLRGAEPPSRAQENVRVPEVPRVVTAPVAPPPAPTPVVTAPAVQPLPPPIQVSTPPAESKPGYPPARTDDPSRPTPPADIPDPRPPLDLRADAAPDAPPPGRPSVADDVLSAAKSMFHSVLPK